VGEAPEQFEDLAQLAAAAANASAAEAIARASLGERDWWLYVLLKQGTVQIAGDPGSAVFVPGEWADQRLTLEENVEYFFKGALSWRDALTKRGRLERRAVKSLRWEWRESGRIELSSELSVILGPPEKPDGGVGAVS
jgi:hypothetical protein